MNKLKIGVIFGGTSSEHDVSKVSGTSVIKNLNKEKYDIISIYIDKDGKWYTYEKPLEEIDILDIDADVSNDIKPIDNIEKILKSVDVIFSVLHGLGGEDGSIQGLFEMLKVP